MGLHPVGLLCLAETQGQVCALECRRTQLEGSSASQGERLWKKRNTPTPWSWTPSFHKLWEEQFLLFKPCSMWYCIMAARGHRQEHSTGVSYSPRYPFLCHMNLRRREQWGSTDKASLTLDLPQCSFAYFLYLPEILPTHRESRHF